MKHLIKKAENFMHGTIGWMHEGNDGQYCEAGEVVKLTWQPSAGWGLSEAHYIDAGGNIVPITGGEFVMPDSAITIGATFKRFVVQDWHGYKSRDLGPVDHLPVLGANDEGTTAYDKGLKVPVYFDGQDWKSTVDGTVVTPRYLRFDSMGMSMVKILDDVDIYCSCDGGMTWQKMEANRYIVFDSIILAGNLVNRVPTKFAFDGDPVDGSGDVTSLLNGRGGDVELAANAFVALFQDCALLRKAPYFPSTTLATRCYQSMFSGCSGVTEHHFATLNNSASVFANNSSCASLTIDDEVPPTIAANTITGLKADCAIYVPAASVDAYKAAQYWSDRADYIQAIP